jgi:hypothetical protein
MVRCFAWHSSVCVRACVCVFGVVTNRTLIKDVGGQNRVRDLWR